MNPLEPRVAALERIVAWLDRALRNMRPQLAQAYQGLMQQQDPLPASPDVGTGLSVIGLVTSPIGPMSGTTPGTGTFTVQGVAASGVLFSTPKTGVTAYSIHDKTIASGAYIQCTKAAGGLYWVHDIDKCTNLS